MNSPRRVLARADSVGSEAHLAFSANRHGRVVAAFQRAFYVRLGDGWACVGRGDIGRGPLNVPCGQSGPRDWRDLAQPGSTVVLADDALMLGNGRVTLGSAPVWTPPPVPSWTGSTLEEGLRVLRESVPRVLPEGGLAKFARPEQERFARPSTRIERAAAPAVSALVHWIGTTGPTTACPRSAVETLLGLGPGLTPSGDDFIAGTLAGLSALRRHAKARPLAAKVGAMAPYRTGDISNCHLRAAIRVGLREDLQVLLYDVIAGQLTAIPDDVTRLGDTGHHSPWDALAGIVAALHGTLLLAATRSRAAAGFLWQNDRDPPRSVSPNLLQLMRW